MADKEWFRVYADGVPVIYANGELRVCEGILTGDDAVNTILYAAKHGTAATLLELKQALLMEDGRG